MKTRVFAALFALGVGLSGVAIAEETFTPPKISAWDGKNWGPLRFGQTTQDGIKRDFKDGRGDFRNSVELKVEPEPPYKISALFPNVDKNARLDGLVIRYKNENGDGLPVADLARALNGEAPEVHYPTTRHEDWRVAAWPRRGILALTMNGKASWVLLGDPGKVAAVFSSVTATEPTNVTEVPDPAKGKVKEIVYGDVDVSFSLTRIDLDRKERERDSLESDLRRAGDGRAALRYERGTEGIYSLTISARSHDDKDGEGSVSARISGKTPYGKIDVYDSESFKVNKGRKNLEDTPYYRAVTKVQRSVEEKALRELEKQGPPTAEAVRRDQWTRLIEEYRNTKAESSSSGLL